MTGVGERIDEWERLRSGDADAFGRFFDEQFDGLLRWFTRRTAAADLAADLCAETFAVALASVDHYDPAIGPPGAWLQGIARHQFARWVRRRRVESRARNRLGIHLALPQPDDLDLVELRSDLEHRVGPLRSALADLGPALREAVLLRVLEERPYREIGELLGCSEGAARVRVSRGLSQLLERLDDQEPS